MLKFQKTNSSNPDFQFLVHQLDRYLTGVNGENDDFFAQFNKIDQLNHVLIAYQDEKAVACGAIKKFDDQAIEVKRMYVLPELRGKGIASSLLKELELWAAELGFGKCVLETAKSMTDAVALYQKNDYQIIDNYGQYKDIESSVCFEKKL